jgi:Tol biopolymer transport system component
VKQLTFAPTTANGNAQNLAQAIMTQVLESTWSSDSNTVAFSNTNNGTSNIFSIAAAGGAVTQVTTTQSRSPTWH